MLFFIAGLTGKVGGAAAQKLLDAGHTVRTLARDPQKATGWVRQGADVREGNLTDAAQLAAALEGVQGAFLMQPTPAAVSPDFPEAKALNASFAEALRQSPVPRLVALSSIGSQQTSGLGNITQTHLLEEALGDISFPTAFIRAGAFIENNLSGLERAGSTGWFDSFLQPTDRKVQMVATADIGAEVARRLTGDWSGKTIVELGSLYSPDDLAQAMSEVLGRAVQARPIPRERWASVLATIGLPPGKVGPWEEMQDGFNSGWIDFGVPGTEAVAATVTPIQVFQQARTAR
jgi:NAD(P)H dehydrogenase (quinone)